MVPTRKQLVAWEDLEELKVYAREIYPVLRKYTDAELLIEGTAVAEIKGDVWKIKDGYEENVYNTPSLKRGTKGRSTELLL
ncbi:hypothetical protein S7335_1281 [Synechococcus sp. PCC 7335]|uniref:hypothetical protein n=1 Tax=Synechococcus sp. (strain ATCC 29403 / PCC 7335) TaxID=91464 RepID=UPI00017EB1CE|nr:hypothetical protein [Synechococcus sp. PCC 7335]EDX82577.1 hypothetical protein S7335_1281 [Synechococcus sp. PCC 7335]